VRPGGRLVTTTLRRPGAAAARPVTERPVRGGGVGASGGVGDRALQGRGPPADTNQVGRTTSSRRPVGVVPGNRTPSGGAV